MVTNHSILLARHWTFFGGPLRGAFVAAGLSGFHHLPIRFRPLTALLFHINAGNAAHAAILLLVLGSLPQHLCRVKVQNSWGVINKGETG